MNWLTDIVFTAPPSSARARRTRGGASSSSRAPLSAPARPTRTEKEQKEQEISSRVYRMVHDGRSRDDDGERDEQVAAEAENADAMDGDEFDDDDEMEQQNEEAGLHERDENDDDEEEEEEDDEEEDADEDEEDEEEEDLMDEEYESMTVSELRDMLHERELPTSGVKSELVTRLQENDDELVDAVDVGEYSKSLEMSMQASKKVSDLSFLNERLHDIIQNETHKDKEVNVLRNQLRVLRTDHASDLAELSMDTAVRAIREKSKQGFHFIAAATKDDEASLANMVARLNKLKQQEKNTTEEMDKDRKDRDDAIARGEAVGTKIVKVIAATAAVKTHTQKNKSEAVVAEGWFSLYDTALEGIDKEAAKHDEQRDQMVDKLQSIIVDVTDENNGQVSMMERHSADIISESKEHTQKRYEHRSKVLKEKYSKLRELLETQHELGDDALQKHQQYLEDHYQAKNDEKCGQLSDQVETLAEDVATLADDEAEMRAQVTELQTATAELNSELKSKTQSTKKLASEMSATQASIVSLRDTLYDAHLELEEAERKEQKMATDYEILMVENSHLTEEIDKFGEIVQKAERALAAETTGDSHGGGGFGGGGGTSSLSAISEHRAGKSPKKSPRGASGAGSKRKQTPRSASGKKKRV